MTNPKEVLAHLRENILRLTETEIDEQAREAVEPWIEQILQASQQAAEEWFTLHGDEIDEQTWQQLYKPALMWRFFLHLERGVHQAREGWGTVFFRELADRYGEGE